MEKVLLVDDEVDFVEINKAALESKGYEVIPAYTGKEGLEKALKEKPDIIILDVMMTTKTEGFDVARELRKRKEMQDISLPNIFLPQFLLYTRFFQEFDYRYPPSKKN